MFLSPGSPDRPFHKKIVNTFRYEKYKLNLKLCIVGLCEIVHKLAVINNLTMFHNLENPSVGTLQSWIDRPFAPPELSCPKMPLGSELSGLAF